MNWGPGQEEDQTDHHQEDICSSSSSQFSLLSLASNCISILGDGHLWCGRNGNPAFILHMMVEVVVMVVMLPDICQSDGDAGEAVLYGAAEDRVVEAQVLVRPVLKVGVTL